MSPDSRGKLPRRLYIRRSVELARYGYTDRCIGCHHARLGLKPADHNEECRARIAKHMTADDNLNQRVQIAQDRIFETTPPEAKTGERNPVPMELEGLVMESVRDRLQRYSDCDFLMQVKQNADERNFEERIDTVRCASISPCGGSGFKP